MDAIKFLTRQHRRIESLFSRYERSPSKGKELFGLIERALIPHAILEEMYVYPMLRERVPNGDELAEHAIEEHAEVERTLKHLSGISPETAEFDTGMRQMIDSVAHHVHEEEEDPGLFGMLRTALTRTDLEDLGRTLRAAADITPTRAHPFAPDRPPGNKLLGLPMGMADRLRDRLSGRAEASELDGEDVTHINRRGKRSPTRSRRTGSRKRASSGSRSSANRSRGGASSTSSRSRSKTGSSRRRAAGSKRQQAAKRQVRSASRGKARRR